MFEQFLGSIFPKNNVAVVVSRGPGSWFLCLSLLPTPPTSSTASRRQRRCNATACSRSASPACGCSAADVSWATDVLKNRRN